QKATRNLPITASPSMLSHRIGVEISRVVVEKFDIGDQRGPGEDRFKKVMTQQRILRNAIGESCFERVHIVEALSRVDAFAKKILVNVRRCRSVGIYAGIA